MPLSYHWCWLIAKEIAISDAPVTVSSLLMGEGRACTSSTGGEVTGEAGSARLGECQKRREGLRLRELDTSTLIKTMLRNTQAQRSSRLAVLSQHTPYGLPVAMETQK